VAIARERRVVDGDSHLLAERVLENGIRGVFTWPPKKPIVPEPSRRRLFSMLTKKSKPSCLSRLRLTSAIFTFSTTWLKPVPLCTTTSNVW